jgi:metal-sulfur cluster biosynthetic enzyme
MTTPITITESVYEALGTVIDPEIGLPITDLGLVADVTVDGSTVGVDLVPTTPVCPLGEYLAGVVRQRLSALPGIEHVTVSINRMDKWTPERLSAHARDVLGIMR